MKCEIKSDTKKFVSYCYIEKSVFYLKKKKTKYFIIKNI